MALHKKNTYQYRQRPPIPNASEDSLKAAQAIFKKHTDSVNPTVRTIEFPSKNYYTTNSFSSINAAVVAASHTSKSNTDQDVRTSTSRLPYKLKSNSSEYVPRPSINSLASEPVAVNTGVRPGSATIAAARISKLNASLSTDSLVVSKNNTNKLSSATLAAMKAQSHFEEKEKEKLAELSTSDVTSLQLPPQKLDQRTSSNYSSHSSDGFYQEPSINKDVIVQQKKLIARMTPPSLSNLHIADELESCDSDISSSCISESDDAEGDYSTDDDEEEEGEEGDDDDISIYKPSGPDFSYATANLIAPSTRHDKKKSKVTKLKSKIFRPKKHKNSETQLGITESNKNNHAHNKLKTTLRKNADGFSIENDELPSTDSDSVASDVQSSNDKKKKKKKRTKIKEKLKKTNNEIKNIKSNNIDDISKKFRIFNEDKPWKYHRNVDFINENERKRYEGVWVSNRFRHLNLLDWWPNDAANDLPLTNLLLPEDGLILGAVVKDIWTRSNLSNETLIQIYNLVDQRKDGTLDRKSFIVGMWLVDQCLYGRKLPDKIDDKIWDSIDKFIINIIQKNQNIIMKDNKKKFKQEIKNIKKEQKAARANI
ncbi:hypothetical protein KAFR_0A03530 [Kazachstania africana CBS 2517]|uniref:EH domain-containing protein n=1 Tax=Kazachstania africana (strain ATCC 22294 / BCRC 22015 / CBS 2517 / CECT 1963 / NBRC 1671 / NRRL Y-8276) TaxID=1071382 RepID=H2AN38_KAZAF|nr:hypothetical protein KAFR_0A03530 [Kazachstania africana CBS 2517]CCF55788.1 hypothetical protein KAFR_0A03530 [Kazachstania africana CBS 2517]